MKENSLDKTMVIRVIEEYLWEAGYHETLEALKNESKIEADDLAMMQMKKTILFGEWEEAIKISENFNENVEKKCKYLIQRHHFLELLKDAKQHEAVTMLQEKITPISPDQSSIHELARSLVSNQFQVPERMQLLGQISLLIPNAVPFQRLQVLLMQSIQYQHDNCPNHMISEIDFNLLTDHSCPNRKIRLTPVFEGNSHTDEVWCVAFSHTGGMIASGSKDKSLAVWQLADGKWSLKTNFKSLPDTPIRVAFSPDDCSLLIGCKEGEVRIWSVIDQKWKWSGNHNSRYKAAISAMMWINDEEFMTAGNDKIVCLWRQKDAEMTAHRMLEARSNDLALMNGIIYLTLKESILMGIEASSIQKYTHEDPQQVFNMDLRESSGINCIVPCQRNRLIVGLSSGVLLLVDCSSKRVLRRFSGHSNSRYVIRAAVGGEDKTLIACGSEDGQICFWHVNREEVLHHAHMGTAVVNEIAWSPSDPNCFAAVSDDRQMIIWRFE